MGKKARSNKVTFGYFPEGWCSRYPGAKGDGPKMVVTKADIYEKMIWARRPVCPYCSRRMRMWECGEMVFSCGAGWGTPYLFLCMNDQCPPYVRGWESTRAHYGRCVSYRCIAFPDSENTELMMVMSSVDCLPGLIAEETISADRKRGTDSDESVQALRALFEAGNLDALMDHLFSTDEHYRVRIRAAEFIGELAETDAVEPLRSHTFVNAHVREAVERSAQRVLELTGSMECPYCKEIINAGLAVCPECGRPLV